jgi:hypothetical protein
VSETNNLDEKFDVNVSYGQYFDNDPNRRPTATQTCHRRCAILLPSQSWTDMRWEWSKANKVHFICHSQGGNTVRRLISLMQNGAGGLHDDYFPSNETGRDDWTISVSTLGTPYKGTTVTNVLHNLLSVCFHHFCRSSYGHKLITVIGSKHGDISTCRQIIRDFIVSATDHQSI